MRLQQDELSIPARSLVPPGVDVFHTDDLDELIARFEDSCGVIGFRLHAGLLGLGLGKPIVPVGVDWRGLASIHTFQLWDLAIRPFRFGQASKLRRLTHMLLDGDPALFDRLDRLLDGVGYDGGGGHDRFLHRFHRSDDRIKGVLHLALQL